MTEKNLKSGTRSIIKKTARQSARVITDALFAATSVLSRVDITLTNVVFPYNKKNLSYNRTHDFEGFINDQTVGAAADIKMGCGSGFYNGCGWIAAYNASLIKGLSLHPSEIIDFLEGQGGIILNGLLGANPHTVKAFFDSKGFKTCIYPLPCGMDGLMRSAAAGILMYAHKKGLHFVALEYAEGVYKIYNEYCGLKDCVRVRSADGWLSDPSRGYYAVSLITID